MARSRGVDSQEHDNIMWWSLSDNNIFCSVGSYVPFFTKLSTSPGIVCSSWCQNLLLFGSRSVVFLLYDASWIRLGNQQLYVKVTDWPTIKFSAFVTAALQFKEISHAYEVLSDPEKRDVYDQYGEDALKEGMGGGGASHNPFDIFESFFSGGSGHSFGGIVSNPWPQLPFHLNGSQRCEWQSR